MRVLACLPHYYDRGAHKIMGSSVDSPAARAETVRFCIRALASHLMRSDFLLALRDGCRTSR